MHIFLNLISLIITINLCWCASWKLIWSPEADKEGLKAFEGTEDERGHVHNVTHIYTEGNNYRFDIYVEDRDCATADCDRQRQEVKGMVVDGKNVRMQSGETWKFTYQMYIPSSLHATSSFTHIAQMKVPNADAENGSPIYVMSLRRHGDNQTIEAQVTTGSNNLGHTDLKPLQDKWTDVELEYYVHESKGYANLTLSSGGKVVFNGEKKDVKTFFTDTVRPKWGIYRSLNDAEYLSNSHMLLTKMRGYRYE
jgi:hypothetical protein